MSDDDLVASQAPERGMIVLVGHLGSWPRDLAPLSSRLWSAFSSRASRRRVKARISGLALDPGRGIRVGRQRAGAALDCDEVVRWLLAAGASETDDALFVEQAGAIRLSVEGDASFPPGSWSPRLCIELHLKRAELTSVGTLSPLTEMAASAFEVLDASGYCCSGYVDAGTVDRLRDGSLHWNSPIQPVPWRDEVFWLERQCLDDTLRYRVLDSYWGHYLSPPMVAKLDPDGTFAEEFLALRSRMEDSHQVIRRYPSGGMFITVSGSPADCITWSMGNPQTPWIENAVWLRRRFRLAGLL